MSPAISTTPRRLSRPALRLVRGERAHRFERGPLPDDDRDGLPAGHAIGAAESVLVAGADSSKRAKMLGELRGLLPGGTLFAEAHETWEVLARAPETRMVVLTGDLGDLSAGALVRVLGRRHPMLPVIALGDCTGVAASSDVGAASL